MRVNTKMIYDHDVACWRVALNGRSYPLHCGECFELRIGGDKIPCRLELDRDWYVIVHDVRFNLREKEVYSVVM